MTSVELFVRLIGCEDDLMTTYVMAFTVTARYSLIKFRNMGSGIV